MRYAAWPSPNPQLRSPPCTRFPAPLVLARARRQLRPARRLRRARAAAAPGADTRYVARDVNTLYNAGCDRMRQPQLSAGRADLRRGRAPASLFGLGAPRAADERVQLLCRARSYQVDRIGAPLPLDPPGQSRRALCALSDRAQLLRADQRRDPRPGDHPPGAGVAGRGRPPLSRHALCRRCAAQDRSGPRPSRRQGDGDRPLLPAPPPMARLGGPLPHRGRRLSDHQPRARGADAAHRILSRARHSRGGAARRPRCSAPIIRRPNGISAPTS